MRLDGCRLLITGASRGIGRAFVDAFLEAGAARVFGTARTQAAADRLSAISTRVTPVRLDTTHPDQIARAVETASDIDILVNNAGVLFYANFLAAPDLGQAREEMEVNYFAPLAMCRAFAPTLIGRGGAIVNVLSIASIMYMPLAGSYNASKAAARSMTEGLRIDLAPSGVRVLAVYAGGYDTDMHPDGTDRSRLFPPRLLTSAVLEALASDGPDDVYPDPLSKAVRDMVFRQTAEAAQTAV